MATCYRTHTTGQLSAELVGRRVQLAGWVHRVRNHGTALCFLDLRDRDGTVQVVVDKGAHGIHREDVISVSGVVRPRTTGSQIEVQAEQVEVLNRCQPLPLTIDGAEKFPVNLQLRYRYLYLRRSQMQRNLLIRHRITDFVRRWLIARGFWEVETPLLVKHTTGGARELLVPSRAHRGKSYALAQSPQQHKQMLMVAGLERYFQVARCFRDEDPRSHRQIEFTELDLEASFVAEEDLMRLVESLMLELVTAFYPHRALRDNPFPRLTYDEAARRYGTDRPDLRFGLELVDFGGVWAGSDHPFRATLQAGGQIKGLIIPGASVLCDEEIKRADMLAAQLSAGQKLWLTVSGDLALLGPNGIVIHAESCAGVLTAAGANPGDRVLIVADTPAVVARVLARLRLFFGELLRVRDPNAFAFAWITEFPLFKQDPSGAGWKTAHQAFTAPMDADLPMLATDPGRVRAREYALCLNGWELGGGTVRIHQRELQQRVLEVLGFGLARIEKEFGHLLEALNYGAPPHAGMSIGLDATLRVLGGHESIMDVIAFPKLPDGKDPLTGAPTKV